MKKTTSQLNDAVLASDAAMDSILATFDFAARLSMDHLCDVVDDSLVQTIAMAKRSTQGTRQAMQRRLPWLGL
ncbi:hypothetical protein [Planctomycetes bacterium K23_9]|uniref:Uncharacterized protein n=1 Tax=Stieleria marina TaxID=1930275 RepID=A0A517NZI4_9BACT|nr:hypothetical protein K239x_45320 [Planctomycetes bacterium K23_9]